jgi:ferritin-like metal-binding protein YciE
MTKDIIINGVSIEELKKQRKAIQQGASKIISDSIEAATKLVGEIMESESKDQALTLAQEALEHLETAEVVSGVSGVTFFLPFYEEYGRYDNTEILSSILEQEHLDEEEVNENVDFSWQDKNSLYALCEKLQSMESDSRAWHSSMC